MPSVQPANRSVLPWGDRQGRWTLGADGIYVKDGRRLTLRCSTFTGDPLRKAEGELLQAQLADAGIQLRLSNTSSRTLFGDWLPTGSFDIADFAGAALERGNLGVRRAIGHEGYWHTSRGSIPLASPRSG